VLGLPVRRGAPQGVGGLVDVVKSPGYATGVGLAKYGAEQLRATHGKSEDHAEQQVRAGIGGRIGQWFREVF
jgi:cell division protein FtsA